MRKCCWERIDNCFDMRGLQNIIIFAIALLLPCMVVGQEVETQQEPNYSSDYIVVKKIHSSGIYNVIIVEVTRNNGMEVLLSKKNLSKPKVGTKLKVNDTCLIKMIPIFDLPKNLIPSIYDKGRYIINNRIIYIRYPHYAYHLNYSPDLKGLYYCPTQL